MAKKAKKEDKAPVKGAKVSNGLAAKVRKNTEDIAGMKANWKRFVEIHVGGDSKIGSIRAALMGVIAIGCIAGLAFAGVIEKWDVSGGTASVTESGGVITIAADAITASTTVTLPAGGVASAALADKDELAVLVTPVAVADANGGTNVVTFTITDIAGTAITYPCAFRFVISDDGEGTPAAVAGDVVISAGIELQQVVDKADYWLMTSNGTPSTVVATITDTPGGTNYIHAISPCGRVTKITTVFDIP